MPTLAQCEETSRETQHARTLCGHGDGGYRLAQPAAETRIADIIVAVDEPIKATRCRSDSTKGCLGRTGRCLTHDLWEELGRQIEVFLESVTLADVLERRVLGRARAAGAADSSHAAAA